MPWPPRQQRAIAADLARRGKSQAEISRFFRSHGHGKRKKRKGQTLADRMAGR